MTKDDNVASVLALHHRAQVVFNDHQLLIKITATAPDAEKKADFVFNALSCHENPIDMNSNPN